VVLTNEYRQGKKFRLLNPVNIAPVPTSRTPVSSPLPTAARISHDLFLFPSAPRQPHGQALEPSDAKFPIP